jgi:hypothetical protein
LEKIVQSLSNNSGATGRASNQSETIQQYEAQKHVLVHLEDRVKQLFARLQQPSSMTNTTTSTSIIKLQRDFQRVQNRASQLHETARRSIATIQANIGNQAASNRGENSATANGAWQFSGNESAMDNDSSMEQYRMQQQIQLQEDRLHEEIMREREEEIRNINKGMHTVNEIYKDLAHLVGQQQDHVDQIETQMEDSRTNAESGLKQVEKANEKYGNSQCTVM